MKKTILALSTILSLGTASFFLSSCGEDDPCKNVECGVHGTCNTGTCDCDTGYEIDPINGRCDLISREKFKGTFTVLDTCGRSGFDSYTASIIDGTAINDVKITNFWNTIKTNVVNATVDGAKITIARQEPLGNKFFVQGSGVVKDKAIYWTYYISDESVKPIQIDTCRSKWFK